MRNLVPVKCTNQTLYFEWLQPVITSGDVNEDVIVFDFCPMWDGFRKTAVFYRDAADVYHVLVSDENTCLVPREVLADPGEVHFGVFGDLDDRRRTSEEILLTIKQGAITEATKISDPTPDIYAQLISMMEATSAKVEETEDGAHIIINDVHGATEAVVKHGKDGQNGQDGKDGKDGKDGQDGAKGDDGLVIVENANADELTQHGLYLCRGELVNFPLELDNYYTECLLAVYQNLNSNYIDGVTQVAIFSNLTFGNPHTYIVSRHCDPETIGHTEWSAGVYIPEEYVTGDHLANNIPVSKFKNDAGYVKKEVYEHIETFTVETAEKLSHTLPFAVKRLFVKLKTDGATAAGTMYAVGSKTNSTAGVTLGRVTLRAADAGTMRYSVFEAWQECGYWRAQGHSWNAKPLNTVEERNDYDYFLENACSEYPAITRLTTSAATTLPVGTEVEVWGVRA